MTGSSSRCSRREASSMSPLRPCRVHIPEIIKTMAATRKIESIRCSCIPSTLASRPTRTVPAANVDTGIAPSPLIRTVRERKRYDNLGDRLGHGWNHRRFRRIRPGRVHFGCGRAGRREVRSRNCTSALPSRSSGNDPRQLAGPGSAPRRSGRFFTGNWRARKSSPTRVLSTC